MMFFGCLNVPFNIPKPCPLTMVVGKPIPVKKCEKDANGKFSQEEVDRYHNLMMKSIEQIFHAHKDSFGMGDVTLRIQ